MRDLSASISNVWCWCPFTATKKVYPRKMNRTHLSGYRGTDLEASEDYTKKLEVGGVNKIHSKKLNSPIFRSLGLFDSSNGQKSLRPFRAARKEARFIQRGNTGTPDSLLLAAIQGRPGFGCLNTYCRFRVNPSRLGPPQSSAAGSASAPTSPSAWRAIYFCLAGKPP